MSDSSFMLGWCLRGSDRIELAAYFLRQDDYGFIRWLSNGDDVQKLYRVMSFCWQDDFLLDSFWGYGYSLTTIFDTIAEDRYSLYFLPHGSRGIIDMRIVVS
jgi:hypothetical protein